MKKNFLLVFMCFTMVFFYNCSKEENLISEEATTDEVVLKSEIFDGGYVYSVINKNSGKALDVSGCSTADRANIQQWNYWGGDCQLWKFYYAGNGYFYIQSVKSGKYLDVEDWSTADGGNIIQWPGTGGSNQQWKPIPVDGHYKLQSRYSGKMLEVANASTSNGANVQQWTDNGHNCQQWDITMEQYGGGNFCYRSESGTMTQTGCWGCQAGQSGYIGGDWVLMHRDDAVQFTCSGGRYYWRRIEIEYWNGTGTINPPICEVTGQHILAADTQGDMSGSKCGTCTGCEDYYQQSYYWLNGTVKWTDRERADGAMCAYNLGFKLNRDWSEIQQQSPCILRDTGC